FLGSGDAITGVELKVVDMDRAPQVSERILETLGGFPYRVRDWIEMNSNLFAWMQTEKLVMFVILALIVLVAAFNITGALIMLVMEKKRDVGILRSMGATAREIGTIFVIEGLVIGGIGMVLGTAAGLGLCAILDRYQLIKLPGDVYFIETLPIDVQAWDVVVVQIAVLVISFLATVYPAWTASRLDPVEAIRHE
ncbi:MAG: ABC transporter permease, partial [Candidatus Eisenbacteria bacterium]|nr:ABC transporter permease [Candidatus Eisenbacteria bacterium]